ncbi:hypothetical protein HK104_006502 [Borealophlyctis nickersoniae]|nr:hypothetical protein HK104_006502 [Borealophlyctis nickersoniae]
MKRISPPLPTHLFPYAICALLALLPTLLYLFASTKLSSSATRFPHAAFASFRHAPKPICDWYSLPGFLDDDMMWWPFGWDDETKARHLGCVLPKLGPSDYFELVEKGEELEFLKGKVVLFIGDSQDRNMLNTLCSHTHTKFEHWNWHGTLLNGNLGMQGTGGPFVCHLGHPYNATFMMLFHFGVTRIAGDPAGEHHASDEPVMTTARIEMMAKWMKERGIKEPDLIVLHSLLWDAMHHGGRPFLSPTYLVDWTTGVRSQLYKPVRQAWPSSHLVWRTVPLTKAAWYNNRAVGTLNEAGRHIAHLEGTQVLDWARIMIGRDETLNEEDMMHQKAEGLKVLWRMVFHVLERMAPATE